MNRSLHALIFSAALFAASSASAQDMTFFVTSAGPGDGANLGGLAGADAHCQQLAEAAGATGKTWHAYLSTDAENARDRIGSGPWHNSAGTLIAENVDALHSDANAISKETGAERDRRDNQRPRRRAQPPRHPDRLERRRHGQRRRPARTGRRTAPAAPSSGTTTAWACAMTRRRNRGTCRIRRAAAVRAICRAPAATAFSTASPPTDVRASSPRSRAVVMPGLDPGMHSAAPT